MGNQGFRWLQLHLGRELVRVINPLEPRKEGSGGEVTANEPSYALLELGVCVWTLFISLTTHLPFSPGLY